MIHILVVDDNRDLLKTVCTYLNDCGFEAKGALNANDAYDEMYNHLYDLIISDIMMPGVDGFEFAENVRQVNRRIPILFMSARSDLPSKRKGFQLGIDDYMVKPVELAELEMRVRALLRRANIEMERRLIVGNLELDADGNPMLKYFALEGARADEYCMAFPKGSELTAIFNEGIQALKDSGKLEELIQYWLY